MMLLYTLILISAFVLDLVILLRRYEKTNRFRLNAGLVLVTSFYAYTAALPFSVFVLGAEPAANNVYRTYMLDSVLAVLGLSIGLAIGPQAAVRARHGRPGRRRTAGDNVEVVRGDLMVLTVALTTLAACLYFAYHASFSLDNLAGAYGGGQTITNENVTIVDTLLIPLAISAMLHYMYALKLSRLKGLAIVFLNSLCLLLFAMFFIQGHRNLMLFIGLSAIGLKYYNRPIRLAPFAIIGLLSIIGLYAIGIVRNWGWFQIDQVVVGNDAIDPLHGELGAPYSVYEKLQEGFADQSLLFGRTYTVDFLINLIPQQLWRNRPPSPAVRFSQTYFETDNLTSGLGFSPLVEALINFSRYGIPMVFAVTALGFVWLEYWAGFHKRLGILISSILLPSIVNWNRIDFAACGKMFLVYCAFLWGLDKLFYSPISVPPRERMPTLTGADADADEVRLLVHADQ